MPEMITVKEAEKITVKGVGKTTVLPDYVIVSLVLEAEGKKYAEAVDSAAEKISQLNKALQAVGFEESSVHTKSFHVQPKYRLSKNRKDQMQRILDGYVCTHRLAMEFDYEKERLSKAVETISSSLAEPKLDISFTIKDKESVNERLLEMAAVNAKKRAEILCVSLGVSLGKVISIDYDWKEICFSSKPRFYPGMNETMMLSPTMPPDQSNGQILDLEPHEIDVSDSATFIWEIQNPEQTQ